MRFKKITSVLTFSLISTYLNAQTDALFSIEKDSVRILPFNVLMNKLTVVTGAPLNDPMFNALKEAALQVGHYNHAQGIRPDTGITPIKVSTWAKAVKPICQSPQLQERFPELAHDTTNMLELAFGRRANNDDLQAFGVDKINLPARIEAEHYQFASDTTPGNVLTATACEYWGLDVDVENISSSDCNIGQAGNNEELGYALGQTSGNYDITLSLSSAEENAGVSILINDEIIGSIDAANNGWQNYSDYTLPSIAIPENAILTVRFDKAFTNFNYFYVLEEGNNDRLSIYDSRVVKNLSTPQRHFVNCMSILNSAEFKSL